MSGNCYLLTHYPSGKYRFNTQGICAHRPYLQDQGYLECYSESFLLELFQCLWILIHEVQEDILTLELPTVSMEA